MQTGLDADIQGRITTLVEEIFAANSLPGGVEPDTHLADAGLTSMEMVNLMLGVEAAFDLTLPQSDITPENFQSVETIARLVTQRLHVHAA